MPQFSPADLARLLEFPNETLNVEHKRWLDLSTPESLMRPMLELSLSAVRNDAGIYSFAGDPKNILMGGHYASDHRGVCLIFDRAQDVVTLMHALRVKYVRNLPVLNWIKTFHRDIGKMLFAKHPA